MASSLARVYRSAGQAATDAQTPTSQALNSVLAGAQAAATSANQTLTDEDRAQITLDAQGRIQQLMQEGQTEANAADLTAQLMLSQFATPSQMVKSATADAAAGGSSAGSSPLTSWSAMSTTGKVATVAIGVAAVGGIGYGVYRLSKKGRKRP